MSEMMTGLLGSVAGGGGGGGLMGKLLPWILGGSAVSGTIGNISANRSRNAVLGAEMKQMDMLNKLTPAQITAGITSLERPLSANLVNSVTNATQGRLAERGLSQAPGIFAGSLAQGLAPYELQEQQLAQDAYFKKLGLPISARPSPFGPFPQQTNTSQIWQALISRFMGGMGGGNQVPNTSNIPFDPTNILFPDLPGLTGGGSGGGSMPGYAPGSY